MTDDRGQMKETEDKHPYSVFRRLSSVNAECFEFSMQRRAFHADKLGGA